MLELLMAGNISTLAKYKLSEISPSGTPPESWSPSVNTSILDRAGNSFSAVSQDTGDLVTYDLLTNSWESAVSAGGFALRNGTAFAECGSGNLGTYVKWGVQLSSYNTRALYYAAGKFYAAATWTTNCYLMSQCLVNDVVYIFGGYYNYAVDGNNAMAVRAYGLAVNRVTLHGTTNPSTYPLRYNSAVGSDGTNIFVFGGALTSSTGNTVTKDLLKYTIASKTWSLVSSNIPITISTSGNAPYYKGKFYFLGNSVNNATQNKTLWTYTVATDTWEQVAVFDELNGYRYGLLFVYNDLLYYVCPSLGNTAARRIWTISLN